MINKDEWLNDECSKVKLSSKSISPIQFALLAIFCLLIGGVSVVYCKDDFIDRSTETIDAFRATWECSKCGYRNYEGIERCSVCGKKR